MNNVIDNIEPNLNDVTDLVTTDNFVDDSKKSLYKYGLYLLFTLKLYSPKSIFAGL